MWRSLLFFFDMLMCVFRNMTKLQNQKDSAFFRHQWLGPCSAQSSCTPMKIWRLKYTGKRIMKNIYPCTRPSYLLLGTWQAAILIAQTNENMTNAGISCSRCSLLSLYDRAMSHSFIWPFQPLGKLFKRMGPVIWISISVCILQSQMYRNRLVGSWDANLKSAAWLLGLWVWIRFRRG